MRPIAIDSSAMVEMMIEGPNAATVREALGTATQVFVTSVTRVEVAFVMMGRFGWDRSAFEQNWKAFKVEEVAADASICSLAIDAFETWGKGRDAAKLNFGDCFSYALATSKNVPLLFLSNDFSRTDIAKA
jgi:ribonuclease VapC